MRKSSHSDARTINLNASEQVSLVGERGYEKKKKIPSKCEEIGYLI